VVAAACDGDQRDGYGQQERTLHDAPPRAYGTTTSSDPLRSETHARPPRNSLLTPRLEPGSSDSFWSGYRSPDVTRPAGGRRIGSRLTYAPSGPPKSAVVGPWRAHTEAAPIHAPTTTPRSFGWTSTRSPPSR